MKGPLHVQGRASSLGLDGRIHGMLVENKARKLGGGQRIKSQFMQC